MPYIERPPDDLIHDLAHGLMFSRALLRRLAGKAKHEPSEADCHEVARALIAHLKRNGVEKILRRQTGSHSWPAGRDGPPPDQP